MIRIVQKNIKSYVSNIKKIYITETAILIPLKMKFQHFLKLKQKNKLYLAIFEPSTSEKLIIVP